MRALSVILSLSLFCALSFEDACAQDIRKDTVRVFFRQGRSSVGSDAGENSSALDSLIRIVRDFSRDPYFRMNIEGWASPEDTYRYNDTLSQRRADSVRLWTLEHTGAALPDSSVTVRGMGVDWAGFDSLLARSADFPGRQKALDIVRDVPLWVYEDGRITGSRRKSLMDLRGGEVYRSMIRTLFPPLRRAEVVLSYRPLPRIADVAECVTEPVAQQEPLPMPQQPAVERCCRWNNNSGITYLPYSDEHTELIYNIAHDMFYRNRMQG